MSRYVVRIVGPAGLERFLVRGRETDSMEAATHYSHPANARAAEASYRRKYRQRIYTDVIDTRDHERNVR